jgi:hypothetical protein
MSHPEYLGYAHVNVHDFIFQILLSQFFCVSELSQQGVLPVVLTVVPYLVLVLVPIMRLFIITVLLRSTCYSVICTTVPGTRYLNRYKCKLTKRYR